MNVPEAPLHERVDVASLRPSQNHCEEVDGAQRPKAPPPGIYEDGSLENITIQLGTYHKIRNFHNNLLVPFSRAKHLTIDTHAVAADQLRPLGSKGLAVQHDFASGKGNTSSSITGLGGTYPLYLEAYNRAAERLGMRRSNALQSVAWEAGRAIFTADLKKLKGLRDSVTATWNRHAAGEITIDEARDEIFRLSVAE